MLNIDNFLHENFLVEACGSYIYERNKPNIEIQVPDLIQKLSVNFESLDLEPQEYFDLTNELEQFSLDLENNIYSENTKMIIFALACFIHDHSPLFNKGNIFIDMNRNKVSIELLAISYFKKSPLINLRPPIESENINELMEYFRKCVLTIVSQKYSKNELRTVYIAGCYLSVNDPSFKYSLPMDDTHTLLIIDDRSTFEIACEESVIQDLGRISELISSNSKFSLYLKYSLLIFMILVLVGEIL
jgi:hypothetical protein